MGTGGLDSVIDVLQHESRGIIDAIILKFSLDSMSFKHAGNRRSRLGKSHGRQNMLNRY